MPLSRKLGGPLAAFEATRDAQCRCRTVVSDIDTTQGDLLGGGANLPEVVASRQSASRHFFRCSLAFVVCFATSHTQNKRKTFFDFFLIFFFGFVSCIVAPHLLHKERLKMRKPFVKGTSKKKFHLRKN
jgi:hypothetical protein